MKFLLDTNTCIIYWRGKNSTLKQKLESTATKDIAVCSIVKAELFYGAIKSANPERNLTLQQEFLAQFISLSFDDIAATIWTAFFSSDMLCKRLNAYTFLHLSMREARFMSQNRNGG